MPPFIRHASPCKSAASGEGQEPYLVPIVRYRANMAVAAGTINPVMVGLHRPQERNRKNMSDCHCFCHCSRAISTNMERYRERGDTVRGSNSLAVSPFLLLLITQ
jgi:hypothetical protein